MAGKLQSVAGVGAPNNDPPMSEAAAKFERGELTVEQYLDAIVNASVAVVEGKLPADRIEWLRAMVREQLTIDPVLRERVRQATGRDLQSR